MSKKSAEERAAEVRLEFLEKASELLKIAGIHKFNSSTPIRELVEAAALAYRIGTSAGSIDPPPDPGRGARAPIDPPPDPG